MFALARTMAPAFLRRVMRAASMLGVELRRALMPPLVGRPATLMLSLISTGMQWRGPLSWLLCDEKYKSRFCASAKAVGLSVVMELRCGLR